MPRAPDHDPQLMGKLRPPAEPVSAARVGLQIRNALLAAELQDLTHPYHRQQPIEHQGAAGARP